MFGPRNHGGTLFRAGRQLGSNMPLYYLVHEGPYQQSCWGNISGNAILGRFWASCGRICMNIGGHQAEAFPDLPIQPRTLDFLWKINKSPAKFRKTSQKDVLSGTFVILLCPVTIHWPEICFPPCVCPPMKMMPSAHAHRPCADYWN